MTSAPLTPALRLLAPAFAARLAGILAAVAALVARRFVGMPGLAPHTITVWGWLQRRIARCTRLAGRIAAGQDRTARTRATVHTGGQHTPLPRGQAWLVQLLGAEAASYGCQLQALLDDPAMADLLAAVPELARLVNPLRRMLGAGVRALRPQRFVSQAAMVAMGAALLLPIPHQFAWPRGPDRAT